MSQEVTRIKQRIKSVTGAYKVTSAMKLVSTVKLKKWKNKMLDNRDYTSKIDEVAALVLSYGKESASIYIDNKSKSNKRLYIIVSSTLGLCGSYNSNIFKLADVCLKKDDDAIIFGNKGFIRYENEEFTKISDFREYSSIKDEAIIRQLTKFVHDKYLDGTYREIHMIYSEYKNSLVFNPMDYQILPLEIKDSNDCGYPPLMEPNPKTLVESIVPFYLKTTIFAKLLESEVCEQAARSNAMENACDNALELLDELQIQFNKARQGAITQEIIEIVGAAESL